MICCVVMGCGASQDGTPDKAAEPRTAATETAQEAKSPDLKTEAKPVPAKLEAPVERRLYPAKFSASSHLENDWNKFQENYLATYLGDDNPKTSWTEGKSDVGLGETIMVEHTHLDDATMLRLQIRNGYQKSPSLFTRNARAKEITLKLLPSGLTSKHTLKDAEGWQTVSVEQAQGPLHSYQIQFDSVYKGSHYEDLVVSDIQTFVTSLTPDNPSFELSQKKRLMDWVDDRRLAAKTFKEAAKGSIPVAPRYKSSEVAKSAAPGEGADDFEGIFPLPFKRSEKAWGASGDLYASLDKAATDKFKSWKQVRISVVDKRRIPQSDAFNFPGSWMQAMMWDMGDEPAITMPTTRQLAYFSANALKRVYVESASVDAAKVLKGAAPGCKRKGGDKHFFFTPNAEGPLRQLLIATCGQYEEREGYSTGSYWQVLTYGNDGQLDKLFDHYSAYAFQWSKKSGAPFLNKVARVSTGGANDVNYVAR
jgi:hypothetical protein